ncbi:hypothetical protein HD806DRAFT_134467 [Xylariaceae sp. AK1471]|nr:hypothetical protein HD806DRAFT_134467 [Xylariaceae sp. AK1471]
MNSVEWIVLEFYSWEAITNALRVTLLDIRGLEPFLPHLHLHSDHHSLPLFLFGHDIPKDLSPVIGFKQIPEHPRLVNPCFGLWSEALGHSQNVPSLTVLRNHIDLTTTAELPVRFYFAYREGLVFLRHVLGSRLCAIILVGVRLDSASARRELCDGCENLAASGFD